MKDWQGERQLRRFFNTLDRVYMGPNLVAAGHRIERAVFIHTGASSSNLVKWCVVFCFSKEEVDQSFEI